MSNYEIVEIMRNNVAIMSITKYVTRNYKKYNSCNKNAITKNGQGGVQLVQLVLLKTVEIKSLLQNSCSYKKWCRNYEK